MTLPLVGAVAGERFFISTWLVRGIPVAGNGLEGVALAGDKADISKVLRESRNWVAAMIALEATLRR
jgi:hypothetical protein